MTTRDLLLTRRGVVCVTSTGAPSEDHVRAVELELAALGYVASSKLQARLATASVDELAALRTWAIAALTAHAGGGQKHVPLFRDFPVLPTGIGDLWWDLILDFAEADDQPCLTCGLTGLTHVLPCRHVVCEECFDGRCPVCPVPQPVRPIGPRGVPDERIVYKRLDLGGDELAEARALFTNLCERPQALSPDDRDALLAILADYKIAVLGWLPAKIPVRENIANVFGTLFKSCAPVDVLPHAQRYMTTATDVLRFLAVYSGTDGSLQRETVLKKFAQDVPQTRFWGKVAALFGREAARTEVTLSVRVNRFKVAKLSRALRRTLLQILDGIAPDRLVEDMLRHESYWVWVGEFLHPREYTKRFPNVARAFQIVRRDKRAPAAETWAQRAERAITKRDSDALVSVLAERPGEFARKLDLVLRLAHDDKSRTRVLEMLETVLPALATPVLVTLHAHLPRRDRTQAIRIYWPKGKIATGFAAPDVRPLLPRPTIDAAVSLIDGELLRRFATKPSFRTAVLDEALRDIIVPFNERTASRSAVALPRGSRLAVSPGKVARLFLHWCEPEKDGQTTDLDLSVGFYGEKWNYVGVCAYNRLVLAGANGETLARSAGDLRSAPWPDGASEFIDLDRNRARAEGIRYAVMVVNAFAGMAFGALDRAFAGTMEREDLGGTHFDPRTVELKFALAGEHGVYLPIVFDLRDDLMHWLDISAKGSFEYNNVARSNASIQKLCPQLMSYFASGTRASMFDLGALHVAARCTDVIVRGATSSLFLRRADETALAFHARIIGGEADVRDVPDELAEPTLALLHRGDLDLPAGSVAYALFRERVTPTLSATDLLA